MLSHPRVSHILVLDDDRAIRRTLEKFLSGEGYRVTTTADEREAVAAASGVDVVLLDLGLPTVDGLDVLEQLRKLDDAPTVIVVTARDDMDSTVKAIQRGAWDYVVKPLDVGRMRLTLRRAIEARDATRALRMLVEDGARDIEAGGIIGQSPAMRELYKSIGAISLNRASVLILGESGTGKELVARAIHRASAERERPFVAVNCTAFARELLESELFGHVRGAFTGANADRAGRFELAGNGTLFLDEIAEMPVDLQAKLLRVLQERTFERVGDARPLRVNARIVAATHRDLPAMIARGAFRQDLYYRLNVVVLRLAPLRERREDIGLLTRALLARISREMHKDVRAVSEEALSLLERYDWPGNVRELENVLTRAVVLSRGPVLTADLLPLDAADERAPNGEEPRADDAVLTLRELERRHIAHVLELTQWNKRRACSLLDISRPTLDRKIEDFCLARQER
ncbi:MAG: sigma-54-dependent Fis family transcriptional regulator [Myxococcales bacterium]|nr:sigma-54-dependent Fis family transcriptional regulator [Myxococcales bacterium]